MRVCIMNTKMDMVISRREFLKKSTLVGTGMLMYASGCINVFERNETTTTLENVGLKEAMYYEQLGNEIVRCKLCPNGCVISNDNRGVCGVRINKGGGLYTLAYENPCAAHNDPIEKKPLFHFLPGSYAFSIAIAGCPMRCRFCQNWQISQSLPDETKNIEMSCKDVVDIAKRYNARSVAYTYTEPTSFYEYMYDTAKIAKRNGIKNVIVTCGYINEEPLRELCRYLDGGNVNLKMFSDEVIGKLSNGRMEPILNTILTLNEEKVWFEITYLIIPGWSDDVEQIKNLVKWMEDNLGLNVPLHFLRFMPAYKMKNTPPTPLKTMERAYEIAKSNGLNYVYLGNVARTGRENTYCPNCGKLIIERSGFFVTKNYINNNRCPFCGMRIEGYWK